MANLLPPFARKALIREYWARVVTLTLFMLAVALVSLSIMLLPTYMNLSAQVELMQASLQAAETEQERVDAALSALQTTNRLVRLLREQPDTVPLTRYYYELQTLAGPSVTITRISIQAEDQSVPEIDMSAVAATRQSLIDFLDDLQQHAWFGRVAVPIENLAQSENINFSVRVPVLDNPSL